MTHWHEPNPTAPGRALPPVDHRLVGLRLLMVADSSSTHTHRWAHWFRDRGCRVTVLSPFDAPIAGVEVVQFPPRFRWYHHIPKVRMLMDYLPFQSLLNRLSPQLIHFHFISEGGRRFYWDGVGVPIICSAWGQDVIFDNGLKPGVEESLRDMLGRSTLITATTHQLARATARFAPFAQPIHVIPFGVDLERFSPRAFSPQPTVTLGFVKHLLPKYGPDVMVEAFAEIHRQRPHARLILAGRGGMRDSLARRISELGLQDVIQLPGRIAHENVPDLMRGLDLMVMPSVYESESFGVAAVEASACGIPVVASRVGGVPEAVLHEKTGLLVPPRDVGALARACIELINNPGRRREMGVAGRRFVERYYSWPDNALLMEEVYRAALTGDRPRSVPVFRPEFQPILEVDAASAPPGTPPGTPAARAIEATYHATHPAGQL